MMEKELPGKCKNLIKRLKYDPNFDPESIDFIPVIHELYKDKKNSEGMSKLVDFYANFLFNLRRNEEEMSEIKERKLPLHIESYRQALDFLDEYAWETGKAYGDEKKGNEFEGKGNDHQIFYRNSFKYWDEDLWNLEWWTDITPVKILN